MKKKKPPYVMPYDLALRQNSTVAQNGHKPVTAKNDTRTNPSSIVSQVDDAPAAIGAAEQNATLLREALVHLMAQGLVKSGTVEIPPGASTSTKMTLKEFKAAYANKPGATFRCPEHLKNQLDDD